VNMNITELFVNFTLLGAEWVLWLLLALSVLSVGVMVERWLYFSKREINLDALAADARAAVRAKDASALDKRWARSEAMAARVARRGVAEREHGVEAVSEAMTEEKVRVRADHERYLIVLGTLGNNAPFIGLFGTVLGIIKAFRDLSEDAGAGADAVMEGIYEALVATAVGLMVAIPAVIAFNYYNRRVRRAVTTTDTVAHVILGEMHGSAAAPTAEDG
jgi:biopolymer transport protein ExbB/TolQ